MSHEVARRRSPVNRNDLPIPKRASRLTKSIDSRTATSLLSPATGELGVEVVARLQAGAGNRAIQRLIQASRDRTGRAPVHRKAQGCKCPTATCQCSSETGNREDSSTAVQRFGSQEHVRIGDEALKGEQVLVTGFGHMTHGEMAALGDYFGSVMEIAALAGSPHGREQISYALWKVNPRTPQNPSGRPQPTVSSTARQAVDDRYYRLAAHNEGHFSTGGAPGESNREKYIEGHKKAIETAYFQGLTPLTVRPFDWKAQEAFAAHFLEDSFAGGHIRTERGEIQRHWEGIYPAFNHNLIRTIACHMAAYINHHNNAGWVKTVGGLTDDIAAEVRTLGGAKLSSFSIGDLLSKVLHDADNAGLDVVSPSGPKGGGPMKWRAVGDEHLFVPGVGPPTAAQQQTQEMVKTAVKRSFEEGRNAFSAGVSGGSPLSDLTDQSWFRALELIPSVDPTSTSNPDYDWKKPSIADLPPNIKTLLGNAFGPGGEILNEINSLPVPATKEVLGFTLSTGDAWDCFKKVLLRDPFAMIVDIGNGPVCPAGNNSPC